MCVCVFVREHESKLVQRHISKLEKVISKNITSVCELLKKIKITKCKVRCAR